MTKCTYVLILLTADRSHQNSKNFSYCVMIKAIAMTTKMVVASFIAIIKQCQYYNHTSYKNKNKFWAKNYGDGGSAWPPLKIRHWVILHITVNFSTDILKSSSKLFELG